MFARSAALMALLLVGEAAIRVAPQAPAPAPPPVTAPAAAGARSPRNASYAITARLDPGSRTISGSEILTWRNTSSIPATTLRFHLYYNAWRNSASTWMRERRFTSRPPDEDYAPADWGWIDLTNIRIIGTDGAAGDVTNQLRFIAPDDGNAADRTVAEVPLGRAVAPGAGGQRSDCLVVTRAENVRANRRDWKFLFCRAVVPQDRRARGHRLELPSVPRVDGVFRRLRNLRRAPDRSARMDRRRDRTRARSQGRGRRHDDASLFPGRCP